MILWRFHAFAVRPQDRGIPRREGARFSSSSPRAFPNHSSEFCAASPFRKMPALQDGDYCLADLERHHPLRRSEIPPAGADPRRAAGPGEKSSGSTNFPTRFSPGGAPKCSSTAWWRRVPRPAGRRVRGRHGGKGRAAAHPGLPGEGGSGARRIPGRRSHHSRRHFGRRSLRQPCPHQRRRRSERYRRTRAYVDSILSRPSFAPWIERESAFLAKEPA